MSKYFYFTHKFKAQIIFYANILEFPFIFSDCPLVNPNPPPLLPSSTQVSSMQLRHISLIFRLPTFEPWPSTPTSFFNSREQHDAVVGCSYLRTVVSEAVQQGLRTCSNCDLVSIRPRD